MVAVRWFHRAQTQGVVEIWALACWPAGVSLLLLLIPLWLDFAYP